jgi:enoyl-CoA hydratase/carnithine racemase
MEDTILVERRDDIAVVTINRPEKRNALRAQDWAAIADTLDELGADDDLRCLVLRGAGQNAFCAGADISGFEDERSTREKVRTYEQVTGRAFAAAHTCRHPVIAMVQGFCLGGGFELALGCDLRISGISGRFGIPAKNVGLFLSYSLLELLIDAGGKAIAKEILLEGRALPALEAQAKNLITRVVDDDGLEDDVMSAARRIADGAPLSARWHREALRRIAQPGPYSEAELEAQYDYADSDDYKAGYQAFLDGKKPAFKGR